MPAIALNAAIQKQLFKQQKTYFCLHKKQMNYTITQIASILNTHVINTGVESNKYNDIAHLLIDSRKIIFPESSLFIAIKGPRNDAHQHIQEVYDSGVRNFIVQKNASNIAYKSYPNANFIELEDSLKALQKVAAYNRMQFAIPIIGITGSNGKTIVKEWLYQLLKSKKNIVRSPKSYNSQVGVPLSVWQINLQHQIGIFEAGISQPNEMQNLQKIILPTDGIFTTIGSAHDKGFESTLQKIKEKLKLFEQAQSLVYCSDYEILTNEIKLFEQAHQAIKIFSWSRISKEANVFFSCEIKENTTTIQSTTKQGNTLANILIPFIDEASIYNACTCLAYLISSNINIDDEVQKTFMQLQAVEMRLQLKEAQNNCIIINDSYSSDIQSLSIALDFLEQQSAGYSKTIILSDILETGLSNDLLYTNVAKLLAQKNVTKLIAIGTHINKYKHLFNQTKYFYASTADFINAFYNIDFSHEIILLKGARVFEFEKISKLLEKKIHETVFEINLSALVNNLNVYRTLLKPNTKLMAMVKAFSYGAGSYEIAKVLAYNKVDYLAVAYADEGVTLRRAGITTPIMVMNPEPSSFDSIAANNLEPEIYNFSILNHLLKTNNTETIGIHIEVDSGMKRLGFDANEIDDLISQIKQHNNLHIKSVFTHLAASEASQHDAFTQQQINIFETISNKICHAFNYPIIKHCLNSGGIVRFANAQFNMVRLGIGLYGIDTAEEIQNQLQQIGTLKTIISQIRNISANESIGYGRKGLVQKPSRIAITAIGYADGLNRKLSNGVGYMLVNGQRASIIGNVCMDMTMIDVTDIDCKEGDEVIVFSPELNIGIIANSIGTIPYEVLTSISQRVKRVYFYE